MKYLAVIALICVVALPALANVEERPLSERCWAQATDKNDAIDRCDKLIRQGGLRGKDLAVAFEGRGFAYTRSKKYDAAIADYNEAIKLWPDYWDIYFERAMAYALSGDMERATDDYAKVVALNPKRDLGDVLSRANQLKAMGGKFDGTVEIAYSFSFLYRLVCRYHPAMKKVCPSDVFGPKIKHGNEFCQPCEPELNPWKMR